MGQALDSDGCALGGHQDWDVPTGSVILKAPPLEEKGDKEPNPQGRND